MNQGFFSNLLQTVKSAPKCRVAVPVAQDEACAYAITKAFEEGTVNPILIGKSEEIKKMYSPISTDSSVKIIDESDSSNACKIAVSLVREDKADILMKGNVSTSTILKAVLDSKEGIKKNPLLSHVCFFELETMPGLKLVTDAAINIAPDADTYEQITQNAIEAYLLFGNSPPKVALLSANEKVSPKVPSTMMAKALADKWANRNDVIIDGPISLDLAVSEFSVKIKKYEGRIRGDADIFVVPRIEVGNVFYKALEYYVHAKMAGVVYGAKCPVVLTSRSDSNDTKLFSLLLGVRIWQKQIQSLEKKD